MPSFISKSHNLTFLHIPKTAGTSIHRWMALSARSDSVDLLSLEFPKYRHPRMSEIETLGQVSDNNFSVIRNPWDRMLSAYAFLTQLPQGNGPSSFYIIRFYFNNVMPDTFEGFIQKIDESDQSGDDERILKGIGINWTFTTPCLDWADTESNVTFMKYENLDEEFKAVADIVGNDIPLPHLNASKHIRYQDAYSDASKKLVGKWFAKDIEYGKYLF